MGDKNNQTINPVLVNAISDDPDEKNCVSWVKA